MAPAFPIDYEAISKAMIAAVRDATELDQNHVILFEPEEPNWPRPKPPYFTFKITDGAIRYGSDARMRSDADGTHCVSGHRGLNGSFNSYGRTHQEAMSYMALFQAALATTRTRGILAKVGVAVWRPGTVSDLSALLNTGFEGRAHMDCLFGVASNLVTTQDFIESFELHSTVDTAS